MSIKKYIPTPLVAPLKRLKHPFDRLNAKLAVGREFRLDKRRYAKAMMPEDKFTSARLSGRNLEAQLTKDYHRVEKGLALRDPKRPFGSEVHRRLDMLMPSAPADATYLAHAQSAREALDGWNADGDRRDDISPIRDIAERGISDASAFFNSRHSVRDFDDREVANEALAEAVRLAISTPSVCNRQAWFVRFLEGADARDALKLQNGNLGFGHAIPKIALITVDARMFAGAGERNQAWIEGGLFSMSLVWALHSLGVDSCMLNMSVRNRTSSKLRKRFALDDSELVIMLIGIGYGREGHRRARSPRRTSNEVILAT